MEDKYIFLPSFSLQPNKLVSFNSIFVKDYQTNKIFGLREKRNTIKSNHCDTIKSNQSTNQPSQTELFKPKEIKHPVIHNTTIQKITTNQIKRQSHNFEISQNAYRNLKSKINWLYYLAKSKHVKTYAGKDIYNFKINFLTLTLPSKQLTPTKEVTTNLLNTFLTEIRQRTGMENYVWRLEFQKNRNVHYHIVTDTYLDYHFVLKIWNRILKHNGYITAYQEKFKNISLLEYNKLYNRDGKKEFSQIAKSYAKSKSQNWEQPNSVDCKSVISKKAIANYISKYFGKSKDSQPVSSELDTEENSENLRLWFCSRSLSKLKSVSNYCEAVDYDLFGIVSFCQEVKKVFLKYATVFYFEINKQTGKVRQWLEMLLKDYSKRQGYVPASF